MSLPIFNLSNVDGNNGFSVERPSNFFTYMDTSNAGDINGDGFDDVILGDDYAHPNGSRSGSCYVVFGQASGFDMQMDLTTLDGSNGFRLDGEHELNGIGKWVSDAGDFNGDGFDDVFVSGSGSNPSYVVFGKASGFDAQMGVSGLNGNGGVQINVSGRASNAGDVNGDGFDDLIIESFIIFGKGSGFDAPIDIYSLDGHNGFRLDGEPYSSGLSISDAGDVNGDGFDDLLMGSFSVESGGNYDTGYYSRGASYVVFGKATGFDAVTSVTSLDGSNGFRMSGIGFDNQFGDSIASAGDVNGDGFDDVIIGDPHINSIEFFSGVSYVVFGKASGFAARWDLSTLDGDSGFVLHGGYDGIGLGSSVSGTGDVNGDGFDDLIVGSPHARPDLLTQGVSYVFFGKASGFDPRMDISSADASDGFLLKNPESNEATGRSVGNAGDVNGDGFADLIIDASSTDAYHGSGISYVIFGASDVVGGGLPFISGTSGDDRLEGTSAAEHFDAGDGNDILLGGGGADHFVAGSGDDNIAVPDLGFAILEGGAGRDMLQLQGNDLNLNLTQPHKLSGIETLDLGTGGNKLVATAKTLQDLADINLNEAFTIRGDSSAQVSVRDDGWYDLGRSGTFHDYLHNGMLLQVDNAVQVDFASGTTSVFDLNSLDGQNGFQLLGEGENDGSGATISSAGDVNGDGFDDVIVGTYAYSATFPDDTYKLSTSYVVFGQASGFDSRMNLSTLDGKNGFRMQQASTQDVAMSVVNGAGDVNGDGFDDVIVGVRGHDFSFESYVVFGKASGFDAHFDLKDVNSDNGFRLDGGSAFDNVTPFGSAGDINGDGFDDAIVLARGKESAFGAGTSFVIFGKASGFDATVPLSGLDGSNGFRLDGDSQNHDSAYLVYGAGDVNGDGFDDLIIGSTNPFTDPDFTGSNYVVFGKASGFDARLDLSSLDGSNGFRMDGDNPSESHGYSVRDAGDINGDGFGDIVIGADGKNQEGQSIDTDYVIFGKASGFDAVMTLSGVDGSNGFRLNGNASLGHSNFGASSAGDINGDGFDDLIVGNNESGGLSTFSGPSYVVFGKASGFDAQIDLGSLGDNSVLRLDDIAMGQFRHYFSISAAGDINGDGIDDLTLGSPFSSPNGTYSGASYVIFGSRDFGKGNGGGGGGGELPEIKGTGDDDTLKGSDVAEHFIAGDGNDNLLGRGGADIFDAGAGDDAIRIGDLTFASIDGGDGNDALHLAGADLNLDLTALGNNIHSIETICLYGRGDNTLTLNADSLLDLSDSTNTLKVHGNSGDHIAVHGTDWVDGGSHGFYHTYTHDDAVLLVGANVTVEFV